LNLFRYSSTFCKRGHLTGDFLTGTVHLSLFDYKMFKVLRIGFLAQSSLHRTATTEYIYFISRCDYNTKKYVKSKAI